MSQKGDKADQKDSPDNSVLPFWSIALSSISARESFYLLRLPPRYTMLKAPRPEDARVLSYLALRKAVGVVALALPFVLAIPYWLLQNHALESSISGYYYTGMRNLFVGSLCAISMFMLCARGYDVKDEIAGVFASLCALGV